MTSKLLQTLGLVGALAFAGAGCSRTPIELKNVKYGGYMSPPEESDVACAFYDSEGDRTPVFVDQKVFNANVYDVKGPRLQGNYNVSGYRQFMRNTATNIQSVARSN